MRGGAMAPGGGNFGALGIGTPRSIFGGMANNPSINSLTNANAMSDYSNNLAGFPGFGRGGGLFGTSGMGMMGNMMLGTLARKAARRRRREQLNQPVFAKPMYGGGSNEDPVDTLQGDPDMFGNFDPISQMGAFGEAGLAAAGAGSALANKTEKKPVDPRIQQSLDEGAENYDTRKYLGHKQKNK